MPILFALGPLRDLIAAAIVEGASMTDSESPQTPDFAKMQAMYGKIAQVYLSRVTDAVQAYGAALSKAAASCGDAARPRPPSEAWQDLTSYSTDLIQRSLLFWDTLRQRGNNWLAHEKAGKPPLLDFEYEIIADAREYERPV